MLMPFAMADKRRPTGTRLLLLPDDGLSRALSVLAGDFDQ